MPASKIGCLPLGAFGAKSGFWGSGLREWERESCIGDREKDARGIFRRKRKSFQGSQWKIPSLYPTVSLSCYRNHRSFMPIPILPYPLGVRASTLYHTLTSTVPSCVAPSSPLLDAIDVCVIVMVVATFALLLLPYSASDCSTIRVNACPTSSSALVAGVGTKDTVAGGFTEEKIYCTVYFNFPYLIIYCNTNPTRYRTLFPSIPCFVPYPLKKSLPCYII